MEKENISKEDFEAYVKVQEEGRVNMCDVTTVAMLSGLQKEAIFVIMKNYDYLATKHAEHKANEFMKENEVE